MAEVELKRIAGKMVVMMLDNLEEDGDGRVGASK